MVSGYLGSAPDAQAIYQAVFKEETEKTETPEVTEVVEKAEKTLPESPSEDTIKDGGENTVNHTDQSVNSLMSQFKQVFRNLTDLLISLFREIYLTDYFLSREIKEFIKYDYQLSTKSEPLCKANKVRVSSGFFFMASKTLSRLSLLTHDRKESSAYNEGEQYQSVVFNRGFA